MSKVLQRICWTSRGHYSTERKKTFRNLFEVYSNNTHWLDVYKRVPLVKGKFNYENLLQKVHIEESKNVGCDIHKVVDPLTATWTPDSIRVGALGIKLGSTALWTTNGFRHHVTLIQIKNCHVIDTQISRSDGGVDLLTQMIVGCCDVDENVLAKLPRDVVQWYTERGVFPKQFWTGFPVTKNALLLPGTEITASHFRPGQRVKVRGITIDQGLQGVMRRWGMKGQPASHGQTKTHRKMGATGGGQDPGRIFPGKHMAGHVGGTFSTMGPVQVMRVNTKFNVLYIKGPVPGEIGGFIRIVDAKTRKSPIDEPYFPTHFYEKYPETLHEDLYAEHVYSDLNPSLTFPPHS